MLKILGEIDFQKLTFSKNAWLGGKTCHPEYIACKIFILLTFISRKAFNISRSNFRRELSLSSCLDLSNSFVACSCSLFCHYVNVCKTKETKMLLFKEYLWESLVQILLVLHWYDICVALNWHHIGTALRFSGNTGLCN